MRAPPKCRGEFARTHPTHAFTSQSLNRAGVPDTTRSLPPRAIRQHASSTVDTRVATRDTNRCGSGSIRTCAPATGCACSTHPRCSSSTSTGWPTSRTADGELLAAPGARADVPGRAAARCHRLGQASARATASTCVRTADDVEVAGPDAEGRRPPSRVAHRNGASGLEPIRTIGLSSGLAQRWRGAGAPAR